MVGIRAIYVRLTTICPTLLRFLADVESGWREIIDIVGVEAPID